MSTIILAELDGWHGASGAVRTVRLCTAAWRDWTDPTPWWPLLLPAGGWTLAATAPGEVDGSTRVEVGELQLDERPPANDPFGTPRLTELLDGMRLVGWPVRLYAVQPGRPLSERVPLGRLTVGEVERRRYARVLRPRDRAADLDVRAAGPGAYAGTGGAEGEAALKDKGKELLIGRVRHFEPTYLGMDGGAHLYSATGGRPMGGYVEVRSRGRRIAAEVTTTPAAGQWRQDAATGRLWVGPGDVGTVTCAARGVTVGGVVAETAGAVATFLATTASGALSAAEVDAVAAASLDAGGRKLARWFPAGDGATLRAVLDEIGRSVRADWFMTPGGILTFARRGRPPAGAVPTATLRAGVDFVQAVTRDRVDGIPPRRARLRYAQNGRTLGGNDLVEDVPAAEKSAITTEWLETVSPEDPATVAACPIDREETIETLLSDAAEAAAEALARRDEGVDAPDLYDLPMRRLPTERVGQLVRILDPGHPVFAGAGRVARIVEVAVDLAGIDHRVTALPEAG